MSAPGRPKRELALQAATLRDATPPRAVHAGAGRHGAAALGPLGGKARSAKGAQISAPPAPWLETLRLELREFVPADRPELERLNTDPRVMKYIGDGRISTPDEIAAAIERACRVYRVYPGLGNWRASRRDTGRFIGWFSLKYIPDTVEVEVGYRLLPEAWGKGYATEGASELVRYGFDDVGLEQIIGITHQDNLASQRVLVKAGLADAGWGHYYGWRVRRFAARRDAR